MIWSEFGKYILSPVSHRATPQTGVKICIFEGYGRRGPIYYKWSRQRKIKWTGERRGRCYLVNYPQKSLCVKWTTSDCLHRPWRRGGMQHNVFMAVPAKTLWPQLLPRKCLSKWTPGRAVQAVDDGSTNIKWSNQTTRGTTSFITSHNTIEIKIQRREA